MDLTEMTVDKQRKTLDECKTCSSANDIVEKNGYVCTTHRSIALNFLIRLQERKEIISLLFGMDITEANKREFCEHNQGYVEGQNDLLLELREKLSK